MHTASHHSMPFDWRCKTSWKISGKNTFWCFVGCSIGNLSTIAFFEHIMPSAPLWLVAILAPLMGLITSIAIETFILSKQMHFQAALKTAWGMSFISMIVMQLVTNAVTFLLVGDMKLVWWALIPSLLAGFFSVWPYNYYKIKKYGKKCH